MGYIRKALEKGRLEHAGSRGGGDFAGPRMPTTPPPPRGLRPTVSCQRYEPKEPMGAMGALAPKAPNGGVLAPRESFLTHAPPVAF